MSTKNLSAVALSAALLALSASAFSADLPKGASGKAVGGQDTVHCYNVNGCKGQSDCKTASSSCKGQNGCKGQGFKATAAKDCLSKSGVIADL